jgi:hypothetical protein
LHKAGCCSARPDPRRSAPRCSARPDPKGVPRRAATKAFRSRAACGRSAAASWSEPTWLRSHAIGRGIVIDETLDLDGIDDEFGSPILLSNIGLVMLTGFAGEDIFFTARAGRRGSYSLTAKRVSCR